MMTKFYRKEKRGKLKKITKDEKDKLIELGCKWHKDIHKTYTNHPTYFLTESKRNMQLLDKIRNVG